MKTKIVLLMVCSLLSILSFPALAKKDTPKISEVFVDTVNNPSIFWDQFQTGDLTRWSN